MSRAVKPQNDTTRNKNPNPEGECVPWKQASSVAFTLSVELNVLTSQRMKNTTTSMHLVSFLNVIGILKCSVLIPFNFSLKCIFRK